MSVGLTLVLFNPKILYDADVVSIRRGQKRGMPLSLSISLVGLSLWIRKFCPEMVVGPLAEGNTTLLVTAQDSRYNQIKLFESGPLSTYLQT